MRLLAFVLLAATPAATPVATPAGDQPAILQVPAASDAPPTTDAPEVDGRKLLLKCEKKFLKLETIKGTAKDQALQHGTDDPTAAPILTSSDFVYKRFDRVRWENLKPLPHSVIWNGKNLWIWSPQENAVVEEKAEEVPMTVRAAFSVQPGFGIDHLAPIPIEEYKIDVKKIVKGAGDPQQGHLVITLTPIDIKTPRATMQLVVDPEKNVVTRILSLVGTTGGEALALSDVSFSKHVEAATGIWFPTRVHSRTMLPDGTELEQVRTYERLKFNVSVEDAKFDFVAPKDAKKIPLAVATGLAPVQAK